MIGIYMRRILFILLMASNLVYANESKMDIDSNLNSVPACIFINEGIESDGKSLFQNLSYVCSDEAKQKPSFIMNDNQLDGSDFGNIVKFKIETTKENKKFFSEFFLITY